VNSDSKYVYPISFSEKFENFLSHPLDHQWRVFIFCL